MDKRNATRRQNIRTKVSFMFFFNVFAQNAESPFGFWSALDGMTDGYNCDLVSTWSYQSVATNGNKMVLDKCINGGNIVGNQWC